MRSLVHLLIYLVDVSVSRVCRYLRCASFDVSSDCLGKEILSLFAVGAISSTSFDLSSDCLGQEI